MEGAEAMERHGGLVAPSKKLETVAKLCRDYIIFCSFFSFVLSLSDI